MAFIDSQGTIVTVSDGAEVTPAQIVIGQIDTIGTLAGGDRTERDRTTLASTAMEYGYGLKDNGVFTLNCFFDPTDVGQARLIALHDAATAVATQFEITFSNAVKWTFDGIVTAAPLEVPKNADLTVAYSIRISGAITKA